MSQTAGPSASAGCSQTKTPDASLVDLVQCPVCARPCKGQRGLRIHQGKAHKVHIPAPPDSQVTRNAPVAGGGTQPPSSVGAFWAILGQFKQNCPLIKRIPRGARTCVAASLSRAIKDVLTNNDGPSWEQLLLYAYRTLHVDKDKMEDPIPSCETPEAVASQTEDPTPPPPAAGSPPPPRKVLQRVETVPDIKRDTSGVTTQYIAAAIVNIGAFAGGVCVAWSSSALPLLIHSASEAIDEPRTPILNETSLSSKHMELSENDASWVASLLCLGAFWGAIPAGLLSEYFGRKKTLLYLALPLVVSWILVGSSPNVYGLCLGRFVAGLAVGAFSVGIPPYVADIAERQLLPTLVNFYHVHFACGVLFGYIIGLVQHTSWISFLCASIPISFFIAFIFLPESPAYLMSQGKSAEAKAALRYFRGIDNDVDSEVKALKEFIKNYAKNKVTFKQLFYTRSTMKALVVSFGLILFQQMSGIYPIIFYAESIFKTFAISIRPQEAAIILGFFLVSSTYFSTMLLNKVKRRVLLILSFVTMAVCAGSLSMFYHIKIADSSTKDTWSPLLLLCIFVAIYAAGVGPIPWLMLREIFPNNAVRRATAITAGMHWLLAFGVSKLYQNMVAEVKIGWTLCHFSVICIFGAIFVYFFVPETLNKSLEEIQNELDGIQKKKKHRHVVEIIE